MLSSFEMNTSTNKITLMDYKLKEEHKFHMNGKLGCVSLIDINGKEISYNSSVYFIADKLKF